MRNLRRVSIGPFVFVAMILGVRVGSLIYQARVQRDIVSAIRLNRGVGLLDVCGEVFYNWEMTDGVGVAVLATTASRRRPNGW